MAMSSSPALPSAATTITRARTYTHNPYAPVVMPAPVPPGTLHACALFGTVPFVPYPTKEFVQAENAAMMRGGADEGELELVRVFVGQLPYFVTDMQLAWLCHTFGGGTAVVFPERIMKRQACGERLPTGCIHAFCTAAAAEALVEGMHKHLLIDDTGVWVARGKAEQAVLEAYVAAMKRDRTLRVPHRPYDSVVVQLATSTFVPHSLAPTPLSVAVERRPSKHYAKRRGSASSSTGASPMPPGAYVQHDGHGGYSTAAH